MKDDIEQMFKKGDPRTIEVLKKMKAMQEQAIAVAQLNIEELDNEIKELESLYFCGHKVAYEMKTRSSYQLAIKIEGFRACAKAYLNAHTGNSYIAKLDFTRCTDGVPRPEWTNDYPFKKDIESMEEAVEVSLVMLKNLLNNNKCLNTHNIYID